MEEKEFTPITTQEALDAVLKDRLNRQNEKHSKELEALRTQFADYDALKASQTDFETKLNELSNQLSEANEKLTGYDSTIAEKDAQIKAYESLTLKQKYVSEFGLASEAIEFLNGNNEEEIRQSAEKLSKLAPKRIAPLAGAEPVGSDSKTQAFREMLSNLGN